MRVTPTSSSIARNVVVALAGMVALGSVQCARIAGLGEGDAPGGDSVIDGKVTIEPATLAFSDDTQCGSESRARPLITVHNGTAASIHYEVQIPDGAAFKVSGEAVGDIPAGKTLSLPTIATPNVAGENAADVVVTAGTAVQTVHVTANGTGPTMELDPSLVAFGEVRKENGSTVPSIVTVKNSGNQTLVVQDKLISSNAAFTSDGFPLTVPGGQSGTFKVSLAANPAAPDAAALSATMTADVPGLCGARPSLALTGRRVTTDVTVTPDAIDWKTQPCGAAPAAVEVVISNFSDATGQVMYTPTLAAGAASAFQLTDLGSTDGLGKVGQGNDKSPSTARVSVKPKPLPTKAPLGDLTDTLHFAFTGAVTDAKDTTLKVSVTGSILEFTPPTYKFTGDGSLTFTVKNTGTDAVNAFAFGIDKPSGGTWSVDPHNPAVPGLFLGAGQSATGKVTLAGSSAAASAAVTITAGNVFFNSGTICGGGFATLPMTR